MNERLSLTSSPDIFSSYIRYIKHYFKGYNTVLPSIPFCLVLGRKCWVRDRASGGQYRTNYPEDDQT